MKEHPILFSGPMVRAILAKQKTQTRRVVRAAPYDSCDDGIDILFATGLNCPHGQPGDRLWVREAFRPYPPHPGGKWEIVYAADAASVACEAPSTYRPVLYNYERWYPSIHMPRWACRLVLEITDVRVERLQAINEKDARAEGASIGQYYDGATTEPKTYREAFSHLWDSLATPGARWEDNPWVWVIGFKVVTA